MEAQLQKLFENSTEYRGLNFVTVEELNKFGCWCYFENDHGRGKSQPVSAVDGACKILHDVFYRIFSSQPNFWGWITVE